MNKLYFYYEDYIDLVIYLLKIKNNELFPKKDYEYYIIISCFFYLNTLIKE